MKRLIFVIFFPILFSGCIPDKSFFGFGDGNNKKQTKSSDVKEVRKVSIETIVHSSGIKEFDEAVDMDNSQS